MVATYRRVAKEGGRYLRYYNKYMISVAYMYILCLKIDCGLREAWIDWTGKFRHIEVCYATWDSFTPIACDVHRVGSSGVKTALSAFDGVAKKAVDVDYAFRCIIDRVHAQFCRLVNCGSMLV